MGARDELMAAADRLFYERGLTATGVDAISAAAGVAKMSLYHHFGSKDGLIAAYLAERDRRWWEEIDRRSEATGDPLVRLHILVDAYRDRASGTDYRGCAFLNAAAELPESDHPARQVIATHKQRVVGRLERDLDAANAAEPRATAVKVFGLLEGLLAVAALDRSSVAITEIRDLAHRLIDEAADRP